MKYITFPTEKLNEVPQELLDELHLVPRKSVDGTEVIMKIDNYEKLFPSVVTIDEDGNPAEIFYPYPTYEGDALKNLLSGIIWTSNNDSIL